MRLRAMVIFMAAAGFAQLAQADDLWGIYQAAVKADPVVLQAAAEKERALEAVNASRAPLLPQINLAADYTRVYSSEDYRESKGPAVGLNLVQSIYDGGNWVSLSQSEKSAHYADLGYALALQDLMVRATAAYFDVLKAYDDVEFVVAEKTAISRQLEQTKQRFEVGLSAITDVHEAQAEYDLSVANEITLRNALESAYQGVRQITGQDHRNLNILDTARFAPALPAPESALGWYKLAEESSLALARAKVQTDIAKEQIDLAQTGHYPTLDLLAGSQYSDRNEMSAAASSDSGATDTSIGLQLNVPIYSGGGISSAVKQAQFQYVAASESLSETQRAVYRSTIDSYNTLAAAISAIRAYEQTVVSRQSALDATSAGFEVGTRTIVDVLDSTRALYDAKRNLSGARYAFIRAVFNLKLAAGTLTENDLVDVNKVLTALPASNS